MSNRYIVIDLNGRWGIFDTIAYRIKAICLKENMANKVCKEWNELDLKEKAKI